MRYNPPFFASDFPAMTIAEPILSAVSLAHASWHEILLRGLENMDAADPAYLPALAADQFLPTQGRLFAAFAQPLDQVKYVLVGEGPYPRAESATGVCFMDGAVGSLWSDAAGGALSKPVNKATSLRNFMKMLLVADGLLDEEGSTGPALAAAAQRARTAAGCAETLGHIQDKLHANGFLLLNASLVFRAHVAPVKDAKAWRPFFDTVMQALAAHQPKLILWGKIAADLNKLASVQALPQIVAEHPYNVSFIGNKEMQALFRPMALLRR